MYKESKIYKALESHPSCKTCKHISVDIDDKPCDGCHGVANWELNLGITRELELLYEALETIQAQRWFEQDFPRGITNADLLRKYRAHKAGKR